MIIRDINKKELPDFFKATIKNLLAYDCTDLDVTPGQILDFQIYSEKITDCLDRDMDISESMDSIDRLFDSIMNRAAAKSNGHQGDIARIFIDKQFNINKKYGT